MDEQPKPQKPAMDVQTLRALALTLAVMHHGLANFAEKSIPAKSETVMATAKMFEDWLNGKPQPSTSNRRH